MIFYRILGNDIPQRHGAEQTPSNLEFILRHEPELPGCEKRFLLNRIVDAQVGERLKSTLDAARTQWHEIPFDRTAFAKLETVAEKALYLTHQNAARNHCIDLALAEKETVLPFDGQTFFTLGGWNRLCEGLRANSAAPYVTVPMFRLSSNTVALDSWDRVGVEDADRIRTEPQLVVRRGHDARYNELLTYGQANKVELLMRLGVPGPWDHSPMPLLDGIRAGLDRSRSQSFGTVPQAGFVFRLESGNRIADGNIRLRAQTRIAGLTEFVATVDAACR